MKGFSSAFSGTYNSAESRNVRIVNKVNRHKSDGYKTHVQGEPDSVDIISKDGKVVRENYYDSNGNIYLTIDYTNHGNPKQHPNVPHEHRWKNDGGHFSHGKGDE